MDPAQTRVVTVGMIDPLGQIVREAANEAITQRQIAMTYAFAIRQQETDFRAANEAIITRWGAKGLERVKMAAWKLVSGEVQP